MNTHFEHVVEEKTFLKRSQAPFVRQCEAKNSVCGSRVPIEHHMLAFCIDLFSILSEDTVVYIHIIDQIEVTLFTYYPGENQKQDA